MEKTIFIRKEWKISLPEYYICDMRYIQCRNLIFKTISNKVKLRLWLEKSC